jgi:Helicase HerA, central domain
MSTRNVVISDGNAVDQSERDRLPDHQDAYGYAVRPAARRGLDWRPMLALILIGGAVAVYLAVRFVEWLSHVNDETAWLDVYLVAGLKIVLFVAPVVLLALAGFYLLNAARTRRIVRLPNQMPITVRDIEADDWQPSALASLAAFYALQSEWARHSDYRSLNQLDLSRALTTKGEAVDVPELPAPALAPVRVSEWLAWIDKRPHVLLAAETGGGKSTTAKAILARRIASGESIFVIDPHSSDWFSLPSVGGGENWYEVQTAMQAVADEYRRRLEERDTYNRETGRELDRAQFPRLTVLLDETNNARAALDKARRGEISPWQQFAQVLGSGARKVNISIVLLCQANVEDLGLSGPMRQNFTRIALDDRTAKLMIAHDESDPERRKLLFAALIGRSYPAVAVFDGQVHILDRTGLDDYQRPANARSCAWSGYGAIHSAIEQGTETRQNGHGPHSAMGAMDIATLNDAQREYLVRVLTRKGFSTRDVQKVVKMDYNRVCDIAREAR